MLFLNFFLLYLIETVYLCILKPKKLSSIVKFLCRYQKDAVDKQSKEIEEELKVQELIQGDKFDKDSERDKLIKNSNAFDYGPMILNLKDVCHANHVDEIHTCLRFYNGQAYTYKIPFTEYEIVYQTLQGIVVNDFTAPFKKEKE